MIKSEIKEMLDDLQSEMKERKYPENLIQTVISWASRCLDLEWGYAFDYVFLPHDSALYNWIVIHGDGDCVDAVANLIVMAREKRFIAKAWTCENEVWVEFKPVDGDKTFVQKVADLVAPK